MKNIVVCGFGNAGHVISCLLGRHANISILNLLQPEVQKMKSIMQESNELVCTHGKSSIKGKIDKITMNPQEVVPNAELIFFAIPSYAQEKYIKEIKPYIKPGQTIVFTPGSSNIKLLVQKHFGEKLFKEITFAAAASLPCRINEFGKSARMLGQKAINSIAVTPSKQAPKIMKVMNELLGVYPLNDQQLQNKTQTMIPKWKALPNYLSITLMNINALIHPSLLYGHLRNWDGKQTYEREIELYADIDESHEQILIDQDNEILSIKNRIQQEDPLYDVKSVQSLHNWFVSSYGKTIQDKSRYYKCIKTNKPYAGLKIPMKKVKSAKINFSKIGQKFIPSFNSRYYTEDVPTYKLIFKISFYSGLVSIKSLAEIAGIKTPRIDEIISWSQKHLQKEFIIGDRLIGKDIPETRALQNFGIKSLKEYLNLNK